MIWVPAVKQGVYVTDGTMRITNIRAFLGAPGDIGVLLDHIDYVARRFGADAVTIGTDQTYTSQLWAESAGKLKFRARQRNLGEALWPADDPVHSPEWRQWHQEQSLAWTNRPLFAVGLVQRGYARSRHFENHWRQYPSGCPRGVDGVVSSGNPI